MIDLSESEVFVAGVARNCSRCLPSEIARLSAVLRKAKKTHFFVVESDSTDNTVEILQLIASSTPHFTYITLGRLADRHPVRTDRIAVCRNAYLDRLRVADLYADCHYVVVADLDGVNDQISAQAVESCWSRDDWDVCTANQVGPYYDIWALRHPIWCPNDFEQVKRFLRSHGVSRYRAHVSAVLSRMVTIAPTSDWIRVDSAFGGLAIYRRHAIEVCSYAGLLSNDGVCEHVTLHSQIIDNGGKIYINPAMTNAGSSYHVREIAGPAHVLCWALCMLGDIRDYLRAFWRHSLQALFSDDQR